MYCILTNKHVFFAHPIHSTDNVYQLETIYITYILSIPSGHSADNVYHQDTIYVTYMYIKYTLSTLYRQRPSFRDYVCHLHT